MPRESLRSEMERLPDSGIYLLLIHLRKDVDISVGSLGVQHFCKGYYVYVGSAQRNLRKRVERHLRNKKKIRWHIDYLLKEGKVIDFYAENLPKEFEERMAMKLKETHKFIPEFGASDSKAPSHLFVLNNIQDWERVKELLREFK
jgi:Uri superfamily endonuclease